MKVQGEAYEDDQNAAYGAILSGGIGGTGALLTTDECISQVKAAEEQMDEVAAMRRRKGEVSALAIKHTGANN